MSKTMRIKPSVRFSTRDNVYTVQEHHWYGWLEVAVFNYDWYEDGRDALLRAIQFINDNGGTDVTPTPTSKEEIDNGTNN